MTLHFDPHVTMKKNKFLFSLFTKILWNALKPWKNSCVNLVGVNLKTLFLAGLTLDILLFKFC